jgi:hypothetical protein
MNDKERELFLWILVTYGRGEFNATDMNRSPAPWRETTKVSGRRTLGKLEVDGYVISGDMAHTYRLTNKAIKELQDE